MSQSWKLKLNDKTFWPLQIKKKYRIRCINKTEEKWNDKRKMARKRKKPKSTKKKHTQLDPYGIWDRARIPLHTHIETVLWESNWIEEKAQHSRFFLLTLSQNALDSRMRWDRFRRTHWVCDNECGLHTAIIISCLYQNMQWYNKRNEKQWNQRRRWQQSTSTQRSSVSIHIVWHGMRDDRMVQDKT